MTQETIDIHLDVNGSHGRYSAQLGDGAEAELTFHRLNPATIALDHTYVPKVDRARGVAAQLVQRAIADARANGDKIVPVCSYVAAQFRRHPEWEDLRAAT